MLEIEELIVRSDPGPRAYITSSWRSWNETSDVRLIEPLTVARRSRSSPVNVNVPPGGREVIPSTPIRASFVTPLVVSMVGSPVSDRLSNLKTAIGRWLGSAQKVSSLRNAVSKAEVEPKAQS